MRATSAPWCRLPGRDAQKPEEWVARKALAAQSAATGGADVGGSNAWAMLASVLQVPVAEGARRAARGLVDRMIRGCAAATRIASAGVHNPIP